MYIYIDMPIRYVRHNLYEIDVTCQFTNTQAHEDVYFDSELKHHFNPGGEISHKFAHVWAMFYSVAWSLPQTSYPMPTYCFRVWFCSC